MYIMKWLMGHPIISIWVLGGIAILLTNNAGNVSHETQESNVSHAVESVEVTKHSEDTMMKHAVTQSMTQNEHAKAEQETSDSKEPVDNTDQLKASGKKAGEVVAEQTEVEKEDSVSTTDAEKLPAEKAMSDDQGQSAVAMATPKFPEGAVGLEKTSAEEMLLMAREAYWNNGLEEATEIYAELIKLHPDVIGYKGELGNVYWQLGYPKKAAELYSEIALPMVEIGNVDRVSNMLGFIGLFYPERAELIKQRIMTMHSSGGMR